MLCCICLRGKKITYTLKRSNKRRSIGLSIDSNGLVVSMPSQEPLHKVESILQDKADWVVKKLLQWENRKSTQLNWKADAIYPLLAKPWQLTMHASGTIQMMPKEIRPQADITQSVALLTAQQIEKFVMAWYYKQALACFSERSTLYANKLGVRYQQLRLSRAKTRWGSCNTRGVIHLNWRLIQMPPDLVDYVVAHELSHLLEMNHSPVFWQLVKSIFPDYLVARKKLKEYG